MPEGPAVLAFHLQWSAFGQSQLHSYADMIILVYEVTSSLGLMVSNEPVTSKSYFLV